EISQHLHVFNAVCTVTNIISAEIVVTSVSTEEGTVLCNLFEGKNNLIYQQYWVNQGFVADAPRRFKYIWPYTSVLTPDSYLVKYGIFSPDW
ncbi:hypothetical protein, partial [Corallococcus sp. AB038B]|uniref:hypothetical protein n=1 Tax=Corallococcus sp. AB038B TaxID=2316718 RepID=UPI001F24468B